MVAAIYLLFVVESLDRLGVFAISLALEPAPQLSAVERLLRDHPGRFEFFQAVRLLLRFSVAGKPVGDFVNPEEEAVRFAVEPSLAFPPSNIEEIAWEGGLARMNVTFMGLIGPAGVLPRCYSSFLLSRLRDRDRALKEFLDLFHHRLISLFYRAWEKHRFGVAYEREGVDRVLNYLTCLVGLGTRNSRSCCRFRTRGCSFIPAFSRCSRVRPPRCDSCWKTTSIFRWKWSSSSESGGRAIQRTNVVSARAIRTANSLASRQ